MAFQGPWGPTGLATKGSGYEQHMLLPRASRYPIFDISDPQNASPGMANSARNLRFWGFKDPDLLRTFGCNSWHEPMWIMVKTSYIQPGSSLITSYVVPT